MAVREHIFSHAVVFFAAVVLVDYVYWSIIMYSDFVSVVSYVSRALKAFCEQWHSSTPIPVKFDRQ